ncbi:MAG: filamentous hemagglutinin N-terminal domain-containing protein, partial [Sphingomonadales bacterium]
MPAYAQALVVDQQRSAQTLRDIAGNGTPVLHIRAPNAAGVSHNLFKEFNVGQQGLILNNSTVRGSSALGGIISANPNLVGRSGGADLIINEVTGNSRSFLQGATEVFGDSADLIIANPFGITCDGCGFVNTPRVTLSTGKPVFGPDGHLGSLLVEGGSVKVEGDGIFAGNVDYFDIVAKSVELNANIFADDLGIYAGQQSFNYGDRNSIGATESAQTGFAIDSSLLGGMYANRIRLVSNAKGVGVNLQGEVSALTGDIEITSAGTLRLRSAVAGGDATVQADDEIVVAERIYAGGEANIVTDSSFTAANGFVAAAGDVNLLAAGDIRLQSSDIYAGLASDGSLSLQGNAYINSDQSIFLDNGRIISSGELDLFGVGFDADEGSVLFADGIQLSLQGSFINGGRIISDAGVDFNISGRTQNAGLISSGQNFALQSSQAIENNGVIEVIGNLDFDGSDKISLTGRTVVNGVVTVSSVNDIDISGTLIGLQGLGLNSGDLIRVADGAEVLSGGNLSITSDIYLQNEGRLLTEGTLYLTAQNIVNDGTLLSNMSSTISAAENFAQTGTLESAGAVSIQGQNLVLGGQVLSNGVVSVDGGALQIGGLISSLEGVSIVSGGSTQISNEGSVTSTGALVVSVANHLNNDGRVAAESGVSLESQTFENSGIIASDLNVALSVAGQADLGGDIEAAGRTDIFAGPLNISGRIVSNNGIAIDADDTELTGTISSLGKVDLKSRG